MINSNKINCIFSAKKCIICTYQGFNDNVKVVSDAKKTISFIKNCNIEINCLLKYLSCNKSHRRLTNKEKMPFYGNGWQEPYTCSALEFYLDLQPSRHDCDYYNFFAGKCDDKASENFPHYFVTLSKKVTRRCLCNWNTAIFR